MVAALEARLVRRAWARGTLEAISPTGASVSESELADGVRPGGAASAGDVTLLIGAAGWLVDILRWRW